MDSYGTRSLREIVRILFSHTLLILTILVVGGVGTWFVCEYYAPRKYRSQVSFIFKRPVYKDSIQADVAGERALEVFVKAQQQIIMSELVLARAKVLAEDSKLRARWDVLRKNWYAARRGEVGTAVNVARRAIENFLVDETFVRKIQMLMTQDQQELIEFRKSVKLETPGGEQVGMTETFQLSVDRPGPRDVRDSQMNAYHAADAIADMYLVRYQELQTQQTEPGLRVMDDVVENYRKEVERRKSAFNEFIQEHIEDITGLEQLQKSGAEQGVQIALSEIRKNDAALAMELAKEQAVYDALKKVLPANSSEPGYINKVSAEEAEHLVNAVASEFMFGDVTFVELSKNLAMLQTRLAKVQSQFLEESRDYQYITQQLEQVYKQMLGQIIARASGMELRVATRQQQKARNEDLVRQFEKSLNKVHSEIVQYVSLKNDFEVAQKQLERLEQDRIDQVTGQVSAKEAVTINRFDGPSIPDVNRPVVPLTVIYTVVASAVSLLIGVTLAFLADHFDHTLRSTVDAERFLGVPVLGSVKKRGRRIVVPG